MELALKAALTAAIVASLIGAVSQWGHRAAGIVSGLPFTALPCLLLLGLEHGPAVAADAAAGSVVGCALAPLFAVVYAGGARRLPPVPALLLSLTCMGVAIVLARALPVTPALGCVAACAATAGALRLLRDPKAIGPSRPAAPARPLRAACGVGLVSAAITMVSGTLSPAMAGIVAAMPLIGVATVALRHANGGPAAVRPYLRGYLVGALGKTGFCALFGLTAPSCGVVPGMLAAVALTGLLGWAILAPPRCFRLPGLSGATAPSTPATAASR